MNVSFLGRLGLVPLGISAWIGLAATARGAAAPPNDNFANAVTISGMYGIPAIGFGPGAEAMAHAPNEKTPVEDLVNAAAFYALYAWSA